MQQHCYERWFLASPRDPVFIIWEPPTCFHAVQASAQAPHKWQRAGKWSYQPGPGCVCLCISHARSSTFFALREVHLLSATSRSSPTTHHQVTGRLWLSPACGHCRGEKALQGKREMGKQSKVVTAWKHTSSPLPADGTIFHPSWRKE